MQAKQMTLPDAVREILNCSLRHLKIHCGRKMPPFESKLHFLPGSGVTSAISKWDFGNNSDL